MDGNTFDPPVIEMSEDVLSTDPFYGVLWVLLSVGIIGNVLVVAWRLGQKREQRSSPLSILIIVLAVSDFIYCIHLLLLESLVTQAYQEQKIWKPISTRVVCFASGSLSWVSCTTAQFAILDIAIYSFQAITNRCSRCCCLLLRKRCLIITIICQVLSALFIIVVISLPYGIIDFALYAVADGDDYNSKNFSKSEQITEIFARCTFAQSNGFGFCSIYNFTASYVINGTIYTKYCPTVDCPTGSKFYAVFATIAATLSTGITVTCAVLYLWVCLKIRREASQANIATSSDVHNLQWRLSVVVFLNTFCWIPATVLHWFAIYYLEVEELSWVTYVNSSTAASILLISISPAVNPLIYTLTGKQFLLSIRKYWRRLKCDISLRRRNSYNYLDDSITGIERCSCIPCVKCVHRFEDFDTPYWNTDRTKLLESTSESREPT